MSDNFLLTLVRSRLKLRPYTKTDGKFVGPPWKNDIGLQSVKDNPRAMFEICKLLQNKPDTCMVTGTAIRPEIVDTDRTLKNFDDKPIKYVVFDLDRYEYKRKERNYENSVAEANEFIADHLPPEFQDTTYILRFSSSFMLGKEDYLRCHIIFLLEEPQYPREIGIWMRKDGIPTDASFYFNLTQPIFTAAPIWKEHVDPLTRQLSHFPRLSLIEKTRTHVLKGWQPYHFDMKDTAKVTNIPPASNLPGKVGSFCRMISPTTVLQQLGYTDEGEGRFLAPTSKTGVAGVMVFRNGYVYSHHEGDPINQVVEKIYHYKRRSLNSYDLSYGWAMINKDKDPNLLKEFDFTLGQAILNDSEYQDEVMAELEYRTEWLSDSGYEGMNRKIIEGVIKDMHDLYLTELSREHMYELIRLKTKQKIKITTLRKMYKSVQRDKATKFDKFDPDAGVRHMANIFKRQKVLYSHHYTERGDFWCYMSRKRIWKRCNSTQTKAFIYQHIHETVPIKMEIDFHKSEQLIRLIIRESCLEAAEFRKGEGWAFKHGRYGILMEDLFSDSHQWQSEKAVKTLKKEDHICKELPITYKEWKEADDTPDMYLDFLVSTCEEDMETVELIREYGGYVLADSYYIHKMLIIEGVPGSGKSILIKILKECIGSQYFEAVSVTGLSSRFGLGNLPDKKLAVMSEAREIDFKVLRSLVPILLKIIGQDHIDTEAKHKNVVTELLDCKLIMLTNMTPILPDDTGALSQRLMMIRFNKKFRNTPEEILGLDRLILKEGTAGIIKWHLKGLERLSKRKKFLEPASGLLVKTVLEEQIDPLKTFIESYFTISMEEHYQPHYIIQKEFIRWFRVYCHSIGQPTKIEYVRKRASIRYIKSLYPNLKISRMVRDGKQEYCIYGLVPEMEIIEMKFQDYEEDLLTQDREEGA